jgi:L-galactose dehydrogenase
MRYRRFGRFGWSVSEIGFGAAWLSGSGEQRQALDQSVALLRQALDLGLNYLDTARAYGPSEEILGQALVGVSQPYYLATKAGCTPGFDYSCDAVLRSFECSLRLLRRERVDLLQLHEAHSVPFARLLGPGGALEALRRLQSEGLVRAIGVTGREPAALARLVDTGEFDSVLSYCDYDLTTRLAKEVLLPAARRRNVAVVLGSPLRCGRFTPSGLRRLREQPGPESARVAQLEAALAGSAVPFQHIALRYLLADPDPAVILSGLASAAELADVLAAAAAGPLSAAAVETIRQIQEETR